MKVLLTGASGYLGGHVLRRLRAEGHAVRCLVRSDRYLPWIEGEGAETSEGDLLDYGSLKRACHGMDRLIHCAALRGHWSGIDEQQFAVNVDGSSNLYRAAQRAGVEGIVHVSTVGAVGCTREGTPLTEDTPWAGTARPDVHYLKSKREAEERAFAAARGGVPITVVNPGSMLGAFAQDGRVKGHVSDVLRRSTARTFAGGSTFADVGGVADGVVRAMESGTRNERYILGGHNRTWLELRTEVARLAGLAEPAGLHAAFRGRLLESFSWALELTPLSRPRFAKDRYRIWGWYTYADSSKARRELGYNVAPLEEILLSTLQEAAP